MSAITHLYNGGIDYVRTFSRENGRRPPNRLCDQIAKRIRQIDPRIPRGVARKHAYYGLIGKPHTDKGTSRWLPVIFDELNKYRENVMFKIKVYLDNATTKTKTGLEALDYRRAMGLPDGVEVNFFYVKPVSTDVDETFARAYFRSNNSILEESSFDLKMLMPGELVPYNPSVHAIEGDNSCVKLNLTPDRVRQLFIAGRMRVKNKD